jgi:hypothetical protein
MALALDQPSGHAGVRQAVRHELGAAAAVGRMGGERAHAGYPKLLEVIGLGLGTPLAREVERVLSAHALSMVHLDR